MLGHPCAQIHDSFLGFSTLTHHKEFLGQEGVKVLHGHNIKVDGEPRIGL